MNPLNARVRHSPHPLLDFCAACGATPVPRDGENCPGKMTADRLAALKPYLAAHGLDVIEPVEPGRLWTRTTKEVL